jgi:lipoyl(octanoyl) transferase
VTPDRLPACRVIIDGKPQSGAWNMAVDELLLEAAVNEGACALRWYRWDQPTLSLGYFQDPTAVSGDAVLAGLPIVRRLSGGGAIVHDQELTYSCALSATHPYAHQPRELYTRIHQCIIEVLAEFGLLAAFRGHHDRKRDGEFLCFGRGDAFDVVIGSEKILGSAQRRRKGAILQHGALVLRRSLHAPQFQGILDFATGPIDVDELSQRLTDRVAQLLSAEPGVQPLSDDELNSVRELVSQRYCRP